MKEALLPSLDKALDKRYSIVSSHVLNRNAITFLQQNHTLTIEISI